MVHTLKHWKVSDHGNQVPDFQGREKIWLSYHLHHTSRHPSSCTHRYARCRKRGAQKPSPELLSSILQNASRVNVSNFGNQDSGGHTRNILRIAPLQTTQSFLTLQ